MYDSKAKSLSVLGWWCWEHVRGPQYIASLRHDNLGLKQGWRGKRSRERWEGSIWFLKWSCPNTRDERMPLRNWLAQLLVVHDSWAQGRPKHNHNHNFPKKFCIRCHIKSANDGASDEKSLCFLCVPLCRSRTLSHSSSRCFSCHHHCPQKCYQQPDTWHKESWATFGVSGTQKSLCSCANLETIVFCFLPAGMCKLFIRYFPELEVHCSTNWRCIAAFPFLQSLEASEAQRYKWGGVLRYKLEVYRQYFSDRLYGLGVPKQSPL